MGDHCEEQEMEAEALTAIFDDCLEVVSNTQPFQWAVTLYPEQHASPEENHVGIKVVATIPLDYPEVSLPSIEIQLLKGLVEEHREELLRLANEEAENNLGLPSIFAICERLREWLAENNVKGMDDVSMYAQMMRREQKAEKETQRAQQKFESQKEEVTMTEAEAEELAVRKRRAEGTPCTPENFEAWKERFEKEMELKKLQEEQEEATGGGATAKRKGGKENKVVDKSGRITGFAHFSDRAGGTIDLEAMEEAAEHAQVDEDEDEEEGETSKLAAAVDDEDLFDVDDEDLDDLDFDDEDEDDEEEPDI